MNKFARFMEGESGTFIAIVAGWAIVAVPGVLLGLTDKDGLGYMSLAGIAGAGWLYIQWLRSR